MKNTVQIFLGCILGLGLVFAFEAWGNQTALSAGGAANLAATCTFAGGQGQTVAVTNVTASTSTATGNGNVRVVCSTDSHFVQGLAGVTGVTATTGDSLIPANTVEYIGANRSTFAFIRDAANGTCYLTECK